MRRKILYILNLKNLNYLRKYYRIRELIRIFKNIYNYYK